MSPRLQLSAQEEAAEASSLWSSVRAKLRSTSGGVLGGISLLDRERLRAAEAEEEHRKQREAAAQAQAEAQADSLAQGDGEGRREHSEEMRDGMRGEPMSAQQRAMERDRQMFSRDNDVGEPADPAAAKRQEKLAALRNGAFAQAALECDVCKKRLYPTDQVNVDGFMLHVKPCGQCGHDRQGTRCGNRAARVINSGGEPLPLCGVHYKQRVAREGGAHAASPRIHTKHAPAEAPAAAPAFGIQLKARVSAVAPNPGIGKGSDERREGEGGSETRAAQPAVEEQRWRRRREGAVVVEAARAARGEEGAAGRQQRRAAEEAARESNVGSCWHRQQRRWRQQQRRHPQRRQ